jgi:hypothetical protein
MALALVFSRIHAAEASQRGAFTWSAVGRGFSDVASLAQNARGKLIFRHIVRSSALRK